MVKEGELLWTPSEAFKARSYIRHFMDWLASERGKAFTDYDALWQWSVDDLEGFWGAVWDYFNVRSVTPYDRVLNTRKMPGAKWFEGSRLNYAEHLLRYGDEHPDAIAFHHLSEIRPLARMSWSEVAGKVRRLATELRGLGIVPGDRVVSYMPNIPETAIAMMAATAIGAVWSSAAPEFGNATVLDRFGQIEPKLVFAVDGYRFGGKDFDRTAQIGQIISRLPSVERVVWLPYMFPDRAPPPGLPEVVLFGDLLSVGPVAAEDFAYEHVAHDHPLWILFSSGTTGLPKGIVHSHVGILVDSLVNGRFPMSLGPGKCLFFYTTTGWMMWNALTSALAHGCAAVLYDGHPAHSQPDLLWKLAAETRATCFGASPTFVQQMEKAGVVPKDSYDFSALEIVMLAGSPSTPETFAWMYRNVKQDFWVTSQSGGTDICSGWVGATPLKPVYAGEIQTHLLGKDVHAWDEDGNELIDQVGEMVVTSPSPSMPLYLWNDPDGTRYHDAYFDTYPGVWRHGDFIKFNRRGGCYVYGRSDSTLNRFGVRIGTAEIYRLVEQVDGVADSLIVCLNTEDGGFYMPLFVKLKDGATLDDTLKTAIVAKLREDASPRHVPDEIHAVPDIPYTLTGKKMEVPVRRILQGAEPDRAASPGSMRDPAALDWVVAFARDHQELKRAV